jgi:hypothetical protein
MSNHKSTKFAYQCRLENQIDETTLKYTFKWIEDKNCIVGDKFGEYTITKVFKNHLLSSEIINVEHH